MDAKASRPERAPGKEGHNPRITNKVSRTTSPLDNPQTSETPPITHHLATAPKHARTREIPTKPKNHTGKDDGNPIHLVTTQIMVMQAVAGIRSSAA